MPTVDLQYLATS